MRRLELGTPIDGQLRLVECGDRLCVDVVFTDAHAGTDIDEVQVRRLRDWLSWWLGEGPEPGEPS